MRIGVCERMQGVRGAFCSPCPRPHTGRAAARAFSARLARHPQPTPRPSARAQMPTQAFFNEDMGVPMVMEPDYETLACRFKFGLPPSEADEAEARAVACFAACPSGGALRATCPTVAGVGLPGWATARGRAGKPAGAAAKAVPCRDGAG